MKASRLWKSLSGAAAFSSLLAATGPASSAEFHVDPEAGSAGGDGSAARPWQTIEEVVDAGRFGAAIKAGDTVWLHSGYHGELALSGGNFATAIAIAAVAGQTPRVSRVSFNNSHGFVVRGLSISPSHAPSPQRGNIVQINGSSSNVTVEDCQVFSVEDASGWSAAQWVNDSSSGIEVGGDAVVIRNNTVQNVRFGISVSGEDALIEFNRVINFSADGLRGLGNNGVFQYNVVKNSYVGDSQDENHDDGFQSWSNGPDGVGTTEVTGVVLRGNLFVNSEDPNQALKGTLQGIGCFDGFFVNWTVENNVVVTNHWHGISFLGMRDSRILNNTVIDNDDGQPGPPWIMVNPHKDGRPSANVTVRNNLATDFDLAGNAIVDDHNATLTDLGAYFVNPAGFDLHLLPNAPAVDNGSSELAPALDLERIPRPQGRAVDQGAYEWHDPSVTPPDAGPGGSGGSAGSPDGSAGTSAGGSGAAAGGRGGTGGAGGSSGPAAAPGISDSEGGCACGVAGTRGYSALFLLLCAAALAVCRRWTSPLSR
jgi:parallel beta-helix repeat protein